MASRYGPLPAERVAPRHHDATSRGVPLQMPARVPWLIALILSLALLALFLGLDHLSVRAGRRASGASTSR